MSPRKSLSIWYVLKKSPEWATLGRADRASPGPTRPTGTSTVNRPSTPSEKKPTRRRVAPVFGLTLLEMIRDQDLPSEVLESEDPAVTMPRRLGLSEVVNRQIRTYQDQVRRGLRMTDEEVSDLVRLVIRRPDSEEVFFRAGRALSDVSPGKSGSLWGRVLPRSARYFLARRATLRRLKWLFRRRVGGFAAGPFTLEARAHILIQSDPGGDACQFVTGLSEAVLRSWTGEGVRVAHDRCEARRDAVCRWSVLEEESTREGERVRDLLLSPEPGTS